MRSFLLCEVFIPKYMTIFLQTRIYMRTKKPIYMRYKQGGGIWVHRKSSYKRHRIIPSAKSLSCAMELKSNFSLNQAWLEQGWVLVIALTVVVVVGSPTTDLLESVDCLLRDSDCTLFHKC